MGVAPVPESKPASKPENKWVRVPPRSGLYWVYFSETRRVSVASVSCEEDRVVMGIDPGRHELRTTVTLLGKYAREVGHLFFHPADVPPPPDFLTDNNSKDIPAREGDTHG